MSLRKRGRPGGPSQGAMPPAQTQGRAVVALRAPWSCNNAARYRYATAKPQRSRGGGENQQGGDGRAPKNCYAHSVERTQAERPWLSRSNGEAIHLFSRARLCRRRPLHAKMWVALAHGPSAGDRWGWWSDRAPCRFDRRMNAHSAHKPASKSALFLKSNRNSDVRKLARLESWLGRSPRGG